MYTRLLPDLETKNVSLRLKNKSTDIYMKFQFWYDKSDLTTLATTSSPPLPSLCESSCSPSISEVPRSMASGEDIMCIEFCTGNALA